ncbi:hypothetical protein M413DRAFT_438454 [Hebeloma cylindrosporum]|uniref:Nucleolar protein 16 n=1 Tax=Hebeloma cylindrosporum TaxID=76867 RepID=A0A0C3CKQ4_HEBCY|nr:hypothetical protein M413DRAFT_438454 [Hebeloma cylindrosporum h7]
MANPRQRRKARSSSHKPVSHSRHAKRNLKKTPPIRGPKVLQDAWDKQKTVRQNYAQLGLVVTLDPSAHGGVEGPLAAGISIETPCEQSSDSALSTASSNVPNGFGRLVRDAAGNVTGFELDDEAVEMQEPDEPVNLEEDLESRLDQAVRLKWAAGFSSTMPKVDGNVVNQLECISASATGSTTLSVPLSGIGSRHVSSGEVKYLRPLVKTYGNNIEGMAGDLKLNPEQRTVGQLRRALRKAGL